MTTISRIVTSSRAIVAALVMLFITTASSANAQAKFDVRCPMVVAQGEHFQVEFIVTNSNDPDLTTPPTFGAGLNVVAGPTSSFSSSTSIVNGNVTQSSSTIYTYLVQAVSLGKLTISSATVTSAGKQLNSKAITIESISNQAAGGGSMGGNSTTHSNQGQSGGSQADPGGKLSPNDILLRVELSRSDVYRAEALVASLKIYTRVNIANIGNPKYPAFNGFWTQELDVSQEEPKREVVGGREYQAHVLRRWLLYPQRTGTIEVEQSSLTAVAQVVTQMSQGNSAFDLFYGGGSQVRNIETKITAPSSKITVKELPKPQPAGFAGAVGRFTLSSSISAKEFAANKAGTIILKLSGSGDFPLIETPKIKLPVAFEQYDVKVHDTITNTIKGTNGTRTYEYPFIARAEGKYTIPTVEIPYFDPSTGQYTTLRSEAFTVQITRDDNASQQGGMTTVSGVTKEDLKLLGQDIRFIRVGAANLTSRDSLMLYSGAWFAIIIALIAALVVGITLLKKQIAQRADLTRQKSKKANKVALRRLKRARNYMSSGEQTKFFEELLRALWGYMGDKLLIDVANLTKERVRTELTQRGVDDQHIDQFMNLVAECEFAQYSPSASVSMQGAYGTALEIMDRFESKNL